MNHDHHNHNKHEGHDKHAGHITSSFLQKFLITIVMFIPLFVFSEQKNISLIIGTFIFFYGGWVFLTSAWRELKAKLPGMMTLIALAITTAFVWSVYSTFIESGMPLWWELVTLIAVMLLGHWIEMRAVQGAKGALKELAKLLPDTAEVVHGSMTHVVSISDLKIGDILLVKPGAKVPADGKIIDGRSELNESIITGESKPISKIIGNEVIAGSINGDGSLKVEVTKIGESTFLAGVMRLVADAETSKSRLQILSDRAAFYLTIIAVIVAIFTLVAWLSVGAGLSVGIERVVAVLVIACPHALGLAIPLVAAISTSMAARNGLLIRRRLALEAARKIDVVLFDKTGTLTEASFKVTSASDEALALAASVNTQSEHPIAKAILEEAKKRGLSLQSVSNFERVPGRGAQGVVNGSKIFVGTKGGDDIVVEKDGKSIGSIVVADALRSESKEAVRNLQKQGIEVAMITGDSESVAKDVADQLGITTYFSRVLPGDKVEKVKMLQAQGKKVAMVGDGVNDAPALTQADLGIAIGAGTNVAIESAGIILVKSDPRDISKIITLSEFTYRKMIQNLFWATGYNVIALPLAAGALAFKGIILQPALAAVFMSMSTVIVAFNAVLLRNKKL